MLYSLELTINFEIDATPLREIIGFFLGNYVAEIFRMVPAIIPTIIIITVGAKESAYYYVAYAIGALLFVNLMQSLCLFL